MKGAVMAWGGILVILLLGSFVIINVVGKGDVSRTIVVNAGSIITFVDESEMLMKTLEQSADFIAQRSAYEYGNSEILFTSASPSLSEFTDGIKNKFLENMPSLDYSGFRKLTWGDSNFSLEACQPVSSSRCFNVEGYKEFTYSDSTYDLTLNAKKAIEKQVSSSIFRLFDIARRIVDDSNYNSLFSNPSQLDTRLESDFSGFDFELNTINNELHIVIEDRSCNLTNDFSCLAPLKSDEPKVNINGNPIPYDYLKLRFRVIV